MLYTLSGECDGECFVTQVDERYVEVTALVPYRFITKVHKGMSADIEFEGYASSEYGLLKAEIEGLEDSIVTVSGRQLLLYEAYYRKRI